MSLNRVNLHSNILLFVSLSYPTFLVVDLWVLTFSCTLYLWMQYYWCTHCMTFKNDLCKRCAISCDPLQTVIWWNLNQTSTSSKSRFIFQSVYKTNHSSFYRVNKIWIWIYIKKKEAVKRDLEEIHCTAEMSLWSFLQCLPWRDRSKKLITEVHIGSTKHASEEIHIKKKEPMKRPCRKPRHFRNDLVVFLWKIHQEKVWKTL